MISQNRAVWGIALLAAVRFLNASKPSEPHIVPYLLEKGFTSQQILRDIFPVVTYSNLLATAVLPFALSASSMGVKGCSLVAAVARVTTRLLLIFGTSVFSIQVSEAFFGVVMAGEVALDAYVVQLAPEALCMRAISLSSAAAHMGYILAAEGGEAALAVGASYDDLFFFSLVTILVAAALTLPLPSPWASLHPPPPQLPCALVDTQHESKSGGPLTGSRVQAAVPAPSMCCGSNTASGLSQPRSGQGAPDRDSHGHWPESERLLHNCRGGGLEGPSAAATPPSPPSNGSNGTEDPELFRTEAATLLHPAPVLCASSEARPDVPHASCACPRCPPTGICSRERPKQAAVMHAWLQSSLLAVARDTCSHPHLLLLSIWWVTVSAPVMTFTESFCSNLFAEVDASVEHNGHVEAAAALARVLGAALMPAMQPLAAAQPGTVHCTWLLVSACCLLALACCSSLLAAYSWYVTVMGMLQLQLCLVQAQVAALVSRGDVAPLFGMLTLCSIALQSVGQVLLQASGSSAQLQFFAVGLWAVSVSACCGAWWVFKKDSDSRGFS